MIDLYSDRWEFAMSQNPDFEETSLFDLFPAEEKKTDKKEQKNEKTEDAAPKDGRGKESAVTAVKAIKPETAPGKEEIPGSQLKDCPVSATPAWTEKFWEYDITKPSQWIRDDMKEHMVAEGFTKREANHIFRGLVFKEKIFNTKNQALAYLKTVPTTWDETRFIDGYPGKYVVLARRHGDTWYLAAVNAGKEIVKLKLDLDMFAGKIVSLYKDDKKGEPQLVTLKVKESGKVQLEILPQGGVVLVNN